MIKSFKRKDAEPLFHDVPIPRFRRIERLVRRKLLYLHRARSLQDLMAPPGNRLEVLKGNRQGQHSIRINDQWRICFRWEQGNAYDVEITDYCAAHMIDHGSPQAAQSGGRVRGGAAARPSR